MDVRIEAITESISRNMKHIKNKNVGLRQNWSKRTIVGEGANSLANGHCMSGRDELLYNWTICLHCREHPKLTFQVVISIA